MTLASREKPRGSPAARESVGAEAGSSGLRFTHLLLTPFNMRISGKPGLDPAWLAHRFDLFERFCFPSVRAQRNREFRWLVFFDSDTPGPFRRRVEAWAEWSNFRPYFSREFNDVRRPVLENIGEGSTHLITTTLDNDDALATTFVDEVQKQFSGQSFELVNFPAGLRLDLRRRKLYANEVRTNPFISLIEPTEGARTIRGCGPHDHLASKFDAIRDVDCEPLWLQVVHDRNITATGIWGCRRVPLRALEGRFGVSFDAGTRESRLALAMENRWRGIERALIGRMSPTMIRRARSLLKRARRS